ncbi:MAG: hypothetical protein GVY14_09530, partial [Spirochaetes bacterium]|nr:hypothetical protein [Spirochaetota bacterium]
MKRLAVGFILLAFALSSCTRDDSASGPGDRGPGDRAGREEQAEERTREQAAEPRGDAFAGGEPRAAESADAGGDGEPGAAPEAAPGAAPGAELPRFSTQGVIRRIPEDVVIGELEDRLDGPDPVLSAVEELFRELAAGRIPRALLAAGVRADLEQRLEYMVERTEVAGDVRIGALVRLSETAYRAPVVAFGTRGGRTNGEIYVAETDG